MHNSTFIQTSRHSGRIYLLKNCLTVSIHFEYALFIATHLTRIGIMNLSVQIPIRMIYILRLIFSPAKTMSLNTICTVLTNHRIPLCRIPASKIIKTIPVFINSPHSVTIAANINYGRIQLRIKIGSIPNVAKRGILLGGCPRDSRILAADKVCHF